MKSKATPLAVGLMQASVIALAVAGGAGAGPAAAQTNIDDVITVTAQKREQSIQDVPIAVSAFSQDDLATSQINDALDLQFSVPNLVFNTAGVTLRGVGNNAIAASSEAGVGVHINGVYIDSPRILENTYFDLERIEVLRGPQGTLYGRNTTGGVINIITAKATNEFDAGLNVGYGNFNSVDVDGFINIPLGGVVSQRFSGAYLRRDGFTENLFTGNDIDGRDQFQLRSTTQFDFSDSTSASLVVSYFEEDSTRAFRGKGACTTDPLFGCSPLSAGFETPDSRTTIFSQLPVAPLILPVDGMGSPVNYFEGALNPTDLRTVNEDLDPTFNSDELFISFELTHDFGNFTLTALTGYQDTSSDFFQDFDRSVATVPLNFPVTYRIDLNNPETTNLIQSGVRNLSETEQFSQEIRLASNFDGPFNFLVGGFYFDSEGASSFNLSHPLFAFTQQFAGLDEAFEIFVIESDPVTIESWAVFAELYYDLTDNTRLTGGFRFSWDDKSIATRTIFLNPGPDGGVSPKTELQANWGVPTGKIGIDHTTKLPFTDETLLYLTASRGYKAGGLNSDVSVPEFDPEFLNAIEIGAKNSIADGRLTANLSAFYYDYEGLQIGQVSPTAAITINADAEIYGAEAEFFARLTDAFQLDLIVSYLETEIKELISADQADPLGQSPGAVVLPGQTPGVSPTPFLQDLSGNELPNSPNVSVKVGAQYAFPAVNGWTVTARGDYFWQGGFFSTEFNKPSDDFDGWSQTNAQLIFTNDNSPISASIFVKNAFDNDDIIRRTQEGPLVGRFRSITVLEPRVFGVRLSYNH